MTQPRIVTENPLIQRLLSLGLPTDDFLVAGSGPLLISGIRRHVRDLDVIARGEAWTRATKLGEVRRAPSGVGHSVRLFDGEIEIFDRWVVGEEDFDELMNESTEVAGLHFVALPRLIQWKRALRRPKDLSDLQLIESALSSSRDSAVQDLREGRMAPADSPVSTDQASDIAKMTAAIIRQFTGGDYGGKALAELQAGEALYEEGLGNPSAFAHTVIDWYALATGDLLHGTGEISYDQHNLAFSSAAVARSTCEYAQIASWLADPEIDFRIRISRTAHLIDRSIKESRKLLDPEQFEDYEAQSASLIRWAQRYLSSKERLPTATSRFKEMDPRAGRWHYAYLSQLAHGDVLPVAQMMGMRLEGGKRFAIDRLWRTLLPTAYVLDMARRLSNLRQRPSAELDQLSELYSYYFTLLAKYEDEG